MAYSEVYHKIVVEYRKEGEFTALGWAVRLDIHSKEQWKFQSSVEFGCCETTITNICRKLKMTRKKNMHYKEQKAEQVAGYQRIVKDIPKNKRVYVYEAVFDSHLFRTYARSAKGERVYERIK